MVDMQRGYPNRKATSRALRTFVAFAAFALLTMMEPAQAAVGPVKAVLAKTLTQPTDMAVRPGETNTVYVSQKTGAVRRLRVSGNSVTLDSVVVLSVADRLSTQNERGLVGITFSPNGAKFYAAYVTKSGALRLAEYPYANGKANKSKERVLLDNPHPSTHHYSGHIAFGKDKLLYMAIGDGFNDGATARDMNSLLGKIIRINPAPSASKPYTIPPTNPFVGQAGKRGEIFHFGLRNPWRWSFDKQTGDQWISDVGQDTLEEVNKLGPGAKGADFGWNLREGTQPYNGGAKPPGAIDPVYEYNHNLGDCSITGGYVYRGTKLTGLAGAYLFTDYCRGKLRALTTSGVVELGPTIDNAVSFGQDSQGELWVLSIQGGVYRLLPA